MRHVKKVRETNGGKIKEQDIPLHRYDMLYVCRRAAAGFSNPGGLVVMWWA